MAVIGITGGIACGKTFISEYLRKQGYLVIDTDEITAALYLESSVQSELKKIFGTAVKQELRSIVFADDGMRKRLEAYLHPIIRQRWKKNIRDAKSPKAGLIFVVIPLLFEAKLENDVDHVITIACSKQTQIDRLTQRPGITLELAEKIIATQLSLDEKIKKSDYVVMNDGDRDSALARVDEIVTRLAKITPRDPNEI